MKKIAFLFLVYDDIVFDDLWAAFFESTDHTKYSIYIHDKNDKPGRFDKYKLPTTVDTEWAKISLVKAQNLLLEEALKDPHNERFIFLSQSCVPVKTFEYIYEYLFYNECSIFNRRPIEFPPRYKGLQYILENFHFATLYKFNEINQVYKASQWCILNRKHASLLSDKQKFNNSRWHNIFGNIFAPDEIFYLTILMNLKLHDEIKTTDDLSYSSTFDNWGPLPKWAREKFGYKGPQDFKFARPLKNRVKTYQQIQQKELDYLLDSESLFARKFTKHCLVVPKTVRLENYLKIFLDIGR